MAVTEGILLVVSVLVFVCLGVAMFKAECF
jgi:hypothetical protein